MLNSFETAIRAAADQFVETLFAAFRGATLEDLALRTRQPPVKRRPALKTVKPAKAGRHTAVRRTQPAAPEAVPEALDSGVTFGKRVLTPPTRMPRVVSRRTAEEIAEATVQIAQLLKKQGSLGAGAIREALGLDLKDLPKVFSQGLGSRKFAKRGQRRGTVYFIPRKAA